MNANFVTQPEAIPGLFNGLKRIEKELDNTQLTHMLRSSWRPSKVSAWIIGLYQRTELESEVINTLNNNPAYCEHLIFSLAFLNTAGSIGAIENHIYQQTRSLTKNFELDRLEWVNFDWAIAAITWLDKINATTRVEKTLSAWNCFKKELEVYEHKYQFKIDTWVNTEDKLKLFNKAMSVARLYR